MVSLTFRGLYTCVCLCQAYPTRGYLSPAYYPVAFRSQNPMNPSNPKNQ